MNGVVYCVQVMTKLGRLYSEMIFVQGYIHCDPHPGNLLVRPSTAGTEIVLLDHGLYQVPCYLSFVDNHMLLTEKQFSYFFLLLASNSVLYSCEK